jgi:hypothetical protein
MSPSFLLDVEIVSLRGSANVILCDGPLHSLETREARQIPDAIDTSGVITNPSSVVMLKRAVF